MTFSIIKTEAHDKVGLVLINRPEAMKGLKAPVGGSGMKTEI